MSGKSKKKTTLDKSSLIKKTILILIAIFFAVLLFLLLLPKKPDIIKGVTYDLKYPGITHYSQISPKVYKNDFKLMREAGINTIRLYGVPPKFILDLADRYNIKVIETIVFPGDWTDFNSPYQLQALKREAIRNINRDIDRECIYAWSIWNDAPWTYGSGRGDVIKAYGKEKVSQFLKELYEAVKKRDPLRPVTAATLTVDEDAKSLGADFLDILGYNVYLGVSDWRSGLYDPELADKMVDELVSISRKYKKPVIITETGYSTYWSAKPQEVVISDQIAKIGKKLEGVILFQWADDWSKAGNVKVHDDDVEEHWGLLEGVRKPKGGYYSAKKMFRNTIFGNIMFAISDYCRGTYFAAKKRTLRRKWREDIIVDNETEKLQNQLWLTPADKKAPDILAELSKKFFEKKGFNQFASYLKDFKSSNKDLEYEGLIDYYIALSGWNKLEYLAEERKWELYYAEKMKHLGNLLDRLQLAANKTEAKRYQLNVLYLQWVIHNDLLSGSENIALERFTEAVNSYSESSGDLEPLMKYSQLLEKQGETQIADKLLLSYTSNVGKIMDAASTASLLKEKAEAVFNSGDFKHAKMLYGAYLNAVLRAYPEEEASFVIFELANLYRRNSLYDESIDTCERLIEEFPNNELADDAAYAIGSVLKTKKTYSKAIKAFRDFIAKYPDSDLSKSAVKETLSIFTIYGGGTRHEKTISFLREIIALYPYSDFSIMARFELASSLDSLGRMEEARREYQYIIDNHPDSDYANYARRSIERMGAE
jgi:TolA-binding protein